jgi:tetratricopeptide (TPR) repeat protein
MEFLKDQKTLYVRHSVTLNDGDQTIEQYFNQVGEFIDKNPVEKLVLDVRMNGGGNNYLNKPIITNIIAAKKINQPGKFFCIIGRRTFSACQNLVNELSKYTEVTFVGEPTSENINFYGDTRTETLPNSRLGVNLSWLWWQNLDPRDKRPWMAPHLATALRFEDYQKGNDPAMEAIETARIEKDIEATLRNLVQQGKFDEATDIAKAYIQNPVHQYSKDDLESKINEYGYRMFEKKQFDTANKVLKMNIDLFPESANAYDSYAESFMRMGKNEEAIRYYEMAIAKDEPKGVTAQNARKMLDQLKR